MKNLFKLIFTSAFLIGFMISCNESEDVVTADAQEGGGLVDTSSSLGKLLGAPKTGSDSIDVISDAELSFTVRFANGGHDGQIERIEVVKYYSGSNITGVDEETGDFLFESVTTDEVVVASFTPAETPFTLSFDSEADFYQDLGLSRADLMIGDVFVFRTKYYLSDGRVLYTAPGDGEYTVTVSCFSDLAGTYTTVITRDDGATATYTQVITETGPGEYITSRLGTWAPGVLATPTGEAPTIIKDVCSQLFIPQQNLGQFYGNQVYGFEGPEAVAGSVDLISGTITFSYAIEFGGVPTIYSEVLTPN